MSGLRFVGFVLAFTLPLCAQRLPLDEHQLGTYRGNDEAARSVMSYCNGIDDSLREQQPRIFAESETDSTTRSKGHAWREFASHDEWAAAGRPVPLAFVWDQDGAIVRVTIVGTVRTSVRPRPRVDYCYAADGNLIRARAVPFVPTSCEVLFPCRLISDWDFYLLHAQRPAITDWVFTPDGTIQKLRNGKAVDDYFDPSSSLTVRELHLKTSADLPFHHEASPK